MCLKYVATCVSLQWEVRASVLLSLSLLNLGVKAEGLTTGKCESSFGIGEVAAVHSTHGVRRCGSVAVTCEAGLVSLALLWSCETEAGGISDSDLGGRGRRKVRISFCAAGRRVGPRAPCLIPCCLLSSKPDCSNLRPSTSQGFLIPGALAPGRPWLQLTLNFKPPTLIRCYHLTALLTDLLQGSKFVRATGASMVASCSPLCLWLPLPGS